MVGIIGEQMTTHLRTAAHLICVAITFIYSPVPSQTCRSFFVPTSIYCWPWRAGGNNEVNRAALASVASMATANLRSASVRAVFNIVSYWLRRCCVVML
jgi:hypothetical protein